MEKIRINYYGVVAIVAPLVIYNHKKNCNQNNNEVKKVSWVISSGSFINIMVIQKENVKFDEYYFIDRLDKDFCEQLVRKKKVIVVDTKSRLYQELGYNVNSKSNHNVLRHYYIFRNRFYYNRKFYDFPIRQVRDVLQIARHILIILMYEEFKMKKIFQLFFAYKDYKQYVNDTKITK